MLSQALLYCIFVICKCCTIKKALGKAVLLRQQTARTCADHSIKTTATAVAPDRCKCTLKYGIDRDKLARRDVVSINFIGRCYRRSFIPSLIAKPVIGRRARQFGVSAIGARLDGRNISDLYITDSIIMNETKVGVV